MHDHGPLPLPKEGGDFAKLIGMVDEARTHSNTLLTKIINEQKEISAKKKEEAKQRYENTKRQKIEGRN